jgi:hypothetical protein
MGFGAPASDVMGVYVILKQLPIAFATRFEHGPVVAVD